MVITMIAGPLHRRARRKTDDHKGALKPLGQLQGTMREHTMISEVHA
jgi:hypothetical protein